MKVFSRKNALLLAALLIALAAACAFALSRAQTAVMLKETAFAPGGERDAMAVSLKATEDLRTIKGEMHLTATNRTGGDLSEIVLRAYANAIQPGSVTLSDATVNGERASIGADSDDPSVWRIETPWRAGETAEVCWRVSLIVPRGEGEIGRTDESALLIGALPTPAMWENGAWRTDGYDELAGTSYGQAMDVRMTLTVPNGVQAAFGGAWVGEWDNGDGTRTLTMQLSSAREISFALRAKGAMRQTTVDGVLVTALAQNARTASRLLDIAAEALEDIGRLGLAYPFPSLTVAQAKTARADGAVGSALIAVDADAKTDALLSRVTRLCARQIFGVQVKNDPWNAPWLSETPASCVELLAYRQREGEAAYEKRFYGEIEIATRLTRPRGVTVGASTERFGGDGEMTQVLRDAGAAGLMGIEQAVGQAAFLSALQCYAEQNAGGVGTPKAFEAALEEATGSDWSGYLADMLAS
ncbi:MAG: hypothetical protein UDN39_11005 [Christensenellales bacterium]|nr:hypothetical protein [Christensenellales bacterium]